MPGKLAMLLLEKQELEKNIKVRLTPRNRSFFEKRISQLKERISKFGQRYSLIEVTISYYCNEYGVTKKIYFTDISEEDAISYTRAIMTGAFTIKEISAITIPTGKLLNKV